MQAEESGQAQLLDQLQLLVQPKARLSFQARLRRVALGKGALADPGQAPDRRLALGEVGIAVAKLFSQVELEPSGQLAGAGHGARVVGKARHHLLGREQDELVVSAPLLLAGLERAVLADGDEHVLK